MLTQKLLKELVNYDMLTGIFTWKYRGAAHFNTKRSCDSWNTRFSNKVAGSKKDSDGKTYRRICINHKHYKSHRLAWLYVTGKFPKEIIDHINGNGLDNRLKNLRSTTLKVNARNSRKRRDNTSGVTGVSWSKQKHKWIAKIGSVQVCESSDINKAIEKRLSEQKLQKFSQDHGSERPYYFKGE